MSSIVAAPLQPDTLGLMPLIEGLSWSFTLLAIITVAVRFYVRRKFSRKWTSDDWLMVVAVLFQILYQVILQIMCHYGLGKAPENIPASDMSKSRMWMWISSPVANTVSIVARISISILLIRIFHLTQPWFKWYLITFCFLFVAFGIMSPIFLFAQVTPVRALWESVPTAVAHIPPTVQYGVSFTLQILFLISDLTFAIIPVCIVWKLKMPTRQKIGLVLVLCMTLITFGSELVKVVLVIIQMTTPSSSGSGNMSYFNGVYNLCTGVEQSLVIIMGCIPPLRPITRLPVVSSLGSTIVSLFGSSRRKGSTAASSGRRDSGPSEHSGDSEPKLRHSDEEKLTTSAYGPSSSNGSNGSLENNGHIRRIDNFSLASTTRENF